MAAPAVVYPCRHAPSEPKLDIPSGRAILGSSLNLNGACLRTEPPGRHSVPNLHPHTRLAGPDNLPQSFLSFAAPFDRGTFLRHRPTTANTPWKGRYPRRDRSARAYAELHSENGGIFCPLLFFVSKPSLITHNGGGLWALAHHSRQKRTTPHGGMTTIRPHFAHLPPHPPIPQALRRCDTKHGA